MFRKSRTLVRKTKPTIDHGRPQTAPASQVPRRDNTDAPAGWPATAPQGSTGHVCADADGPLYFTQKQLILSDLLFRCALLYADGFKHLRAHVATAAFDSYDNVDAPKCHPNTRMVVYLFKYLVEIYLTLYLYCMLTRRCKTTL